MDLKIVAPLVGRLFPAIVLALTQPIGATAATMPPFYPGARSEAISPHGSRSMTSVCGHTYTVEKSLSSAADPHAVAKWYASQMPGSQMVDAGRLEAIVDDPEDASHMTSLEVFAADGSQVVLVSRMNFANSKLSEASKSLGMDRADIGFESISPPLGTAYLSMIQQIVAGRISAKNAKDEMKAMCKG